MVFAVNTNNAVQTDLGGRAALSGTVAAVDVHLEETGFCVLRVAATGHRHQVKVVGVTPRVKPGEFIEANGHWSEYQGKPQFRCEDMRLLAPRTADGVARLLGSGIVKGLGRTTAKRLAKHFGEKLPEIITTQPILLEKVEGIGRSRRQLIEAAWTTIAREREDQLFLESHGVSGALALRLQKTYGSETKEIVRRDPYRLCREVDGVGFRTADRVALGVGFTLDSAARLEAGVLHAVGKIAQAGHCVARLAVILETVRKELTVDGFDPSEPMVMSAIERCVAARHLVTEPGGEETLYFLPRLLANEKRVSTQVLRLVNTAGRWPIGNIDAALQWVQTRNGITLSPSQEQALRRTLQNRVTIVTGGPGTGKSTLLRSVLDILEAKHQRILLAAPTGRAARRMSEATGRPAQTIHRLLGYDGRTRKFTYNAKLPLDADLVVIDEFSMVGLSLAANLLEALPSGCGVLLMGDVDQLPSIDPGAVLADLIGSGAITVSILSEIHRQASGSRIITNAQLIKMGETPIGLDASQLGESDFLFRPIQEPEAIQEEIFSLVCDELVSKGYDPLRDVQVLTPMHKGLLGTEELNRGLQHRLQTSDVSVRRGDLVFRVGDKVLQTQNDLERDISNGDLGIIRSIDHAEKTLVVNFDGRIVPYKFNQLDQLVHGFAASVHKAQGSEMSVIVMPICTNHFMLLDRRLLYTAVTRARDLAILVGQRHALQLAVGNGRSYERETCLARRIRMALEQQKTGPNGVPVAMA